MNTTRRTATLSLSTAERQQGQAAYLAQSLPRTTIESLSPVELTDVCRAVGGLREDCAPCRVRGWTSFDGKAIVLTAYREGGRFDGAILASMSVPLD